jgi:hypothetical protein
MVEVVANNMDGNTNSITLHLPRHIWQQLKGPRLVHHMDSQRKNDKIRQHLGTFLTMSTQLKVILTVFIATHNVDSDWVLDYGASKHVIEKY